MNNNKPILFTLFLTCLLLGIASCRREKPDTPFTRILGKWQKVKYATDDNQNGVIDDREIFFVEFGINNELYFKSDSTGIESHNSDPDLSFKWRIFSGSSLLVQYNAKDTIAYSITNITSVDLTLVTTTDLGLAWYYYVKK